jgi:hypothetical protein
MILNEVTKAYRVQTPDRYLNKTIALILDVYIGNTGKKNKKFHEENYKIIRSNS